MGQFERSEDEFEEYDEQKNILRSSSLCCLVALVGAIIALIVMVAIDGAVKSAVCGTEFAMNLEMICVTKSKTETCPIGQWGPDCTPCLFCGKHGQCIGSGTREGDGTCLCSTGYTGEQCNVCAKGYYGPKCLECDKCNGHGVCNRTNIGSGNCICQDKFAGVNCESCIPGYYGKNCTEMCTVPETCVHGSCNKTTGKCDCKHGYSGDMCEECESGFDMMEKEGMNICEKNFTQVCSVKMRDLELYDLELYYGAQCKRCPVNATINATNKNAACSGHGQCNHGYEGNGACFCESAWFGEYCQFNRTKYETYGESCDLPSSSCSHGHCRSLDNTTMVCLCDKGYVGRSCDQCDEGYHRNGTNHCIDVCATESSNPFELGYFGKQGSCLKCPGTKYAGIQNGCSGHGACNGTNIGICDCNEGYDGEACDSCKPGYFGSTCSPCPTDCGPHGNCAGSGTTSGDGKCVCHSGYFGPACATCAFGYALFGNNGSCHKCPEFEGMPCNFPNGECRYDEGEQQSKCLCESNYIGDNCGSLDPNYNCAASDRCGQYGECKRGKCYCAKGYTGKYCNITGNVQGQCTNNNDCAGSCEICSETEGICVLKDLCCGNGVFMGKCHCKPGYIGTMCETHRGDTTYHWVVGKFEKCTEACGPKNQSKSRTKSRDVECHSFNSNQNIFEVVATEECEAEKQPHTHVICNQFECGVNVTLVDITLDMDFDLVSEEELAFVDLLKADIRNHVDIESKSAIEIVSLSKGSVKVKLTISNEDSENVALDLKNMISDGNEMYKKRKTMKVLGNARSVEYQVIFPYVANDLVHKWTGRNPTKEPVEDIRDIPKPISTGSAAAISISAVFIFVGCLSGSFCFLRGKWAAEAVKRLATSATASKGVANIQLTRIERDTIENPLVSKVASGTADNLLAVAVSTVQRAIQEDERHNFRDALPLYKKANEQFLKAMKSEVDQDARFALAKRVDTYVKREQYLNNMIENERVVNS